MKESNFETARRERQTRLVRSTYELIFNMASFTTFASIGYAPAIFEV
jgi:hypothetical protein